MTSQAECCTKVEGSLTTCFFKNKNIHLCNYIYRSLIKKSFFLLEEELFQILISLLTRFYVL